MARTERAGRVEVLGVVDDVLTNKTKYDVLMQIVHEVQRPLDDDDGKRILANIKTLRERFEPKLVAKEKGRRSSRAVKAA